MRLDALPWGYLDLTEVSRSAQTLVAIRSASQESFSGRIAAQLWEASGEVVLLACAVRS
jgi:hypothetical protein